MADEKEPVLVKITAPDGSEQAFVEDVVIPYDGREFAVLVSIPESKDDTRMPDIVLTRKETNADGDAEYLPPTDEEFEAVSAIYGKM
jgi:uncharacterized protein YrzB (UPF0473 family)